MSLFHCKVFNDLCCYKRKPKFLSMTCNTSANITSPSSMMFQILQDTPFLPRPVLHLQFLFLGAISHYPFTLTPSAEMWLTQKGVLWPPDWIIFSQHIFSWHSRLSLHSSYHNWNYMLILISIHWIPVSVKIVISFGHSLSTVLNPIINYLWGGFWKEHRKSFIVERECGDEQKCKTSVEQLCGNSHKAIFLLGFMF